MRICRECGIEKPEEKFEKNYKCESRRRICEACRSKKRRERNPEYFKEKTRKILSDRARSIYYQSRKYDKKANRSGNDLDVEFIRKEIDKGCYYCGETKLKMTLDRIDNTLPHSKNNVKPACIRCNIFRGTMPYAAWERLLPELKQIRELGLFGDWLPPGA